MSDILLKIEGLHASIGEKEILKGVDLEIRKGEAVGIMGDNGGGKSTLLKHITGVTFPDEEYNTFAGLILKELGEIPEDGSNPEIEVYGLKIKVTKICDHRIESARVTVLEKVQDNS